MLEAKNAILSKLLSMSAPRHRISSTYNFKNNTSKTTASPSEGLYWVTTFKKVQLGKTILYHQHNQVKRSFNLWLV